ncbi:MAG: hypothetical protein FD149_2688 [Rhodospirillaceae bacterium]|nr:MAG: hypothetical protein FD149_2688 [Rhodospirillaceae bacterium]
MTMKTNMSENLTSRVEQHYRIIVSLFEEAGVPMLSIGEDVQ